MIADGPLPDLSTGDRGAAVERLQLRLHAVGLFEADVDGDFGDSTAAAVVTLQRAHGLAEDGRVEASTWDALVQAEAAAGVSYAGGDSATPVGTLSEDQQWRWDGDGWQPNEDVAGPEHAPAAQADRAGDDGGQLSADGQWLWDGNQWQPVPR